MPGPLSAVLVTNMISLCGVADDVGAGFDVGDPLAVVGGAEVGGGSWVAAVGDGTGPQLLIVRERATIRIKSLNKF